MKLRRTWSVTQRFAGVLPVDGLRNENRKEGSKMPHDRIHSSINLCKQCPIKREFFGCSMWFSLGGKPTLQSIEDEHGIELTVAKCPALEKTMPDFVPEETEAPEEG